MERVNLARRPFVNRQPIRRLVLVLWFAGAVLTGLNALFYWRHFSGQDLQQDEMTAVIERTEESRSALAKHAGALERIDLDWQSEQIVFLNYKIAEGGFSWSELLDWLAEVLPPPVRVERLSPRVPELELRDVLNAASAGQVVELSLSGVARTDDALLRFVDKLYRHARFRHPNLSVESRRKDQVTFSMTVDYLPEAMRAGEGPAISEEGP